MSLYNTLFGTNKEMPILLGMLGVNQEYFSRFRDAELIKGGTIIRVFTRLGGGNRECYEETWNKIREHKFYKTDYDDNYDDTYAYIEFSIPNQLQETAKKMFKGEPLSFKEKFEKELKEMSIEGTDASKRADAIAQKFIKALEDKGSINIISL